MNLEEKAKELLTKYRESRSSEPAYYWDYDECYTDGVKDGYKTCLTEKNKEIKKMRKEFCKDFKNYQDAFTSLKNENELLKDYILHCWSEENENEYSNSITNIDKKYEELIADLRVERDKKEKQS